MSRHKYNSVVEREMLKWNLRRVLNWFGVSIIERQWVSLGSWSLHWSRTRVEGYSTNFYTWVLCIGPLQMRGYCN